MSMTEKFGITFGALAPSLAEQLDRKPKDVELWQKHAGALEYDVALTLKELVADARIVKTGTTASTRYQLP